VAASAADAATVTCNRQAATLQVQLKLSLLLWHFSGEWQPKREELLGS